MMNIEVNREVPLREPVDVATTVETAHREIQEIMHLEAASEANDTINLGRVAEPAKELVSAIIALVPEGKEQIIALNNIQSALMWARLGILRQTASRIVFQTRDDPAFMP